jgi:hypothetical protein
MNTHNNTGKDNDHVNTTRSFIITRRYRGAGKSSLLHDLVKARIIDTTKLAGSKIIEPREPIE